MNRPPDKASGDEPDWVAYREAYRLRVRRRFSAGVAVVIAIGGLFVVVVRVFGPLDYPAGDIRNDPLFRVALGAFFLVLIGFAVLGTFRALRRDA